MLEIRNLVKHFGPLVAVDDVSFEVPARRGAGISRAERRRQIDDDEDDHRLPRADRRHRDRLRPRHPDPADRGEAAYRLPARGRARLSRHDGRRVPRFHRPYPRLSRRRGAQARVAQIAETDQHLDEVCNQPIETLSKGYRRRVGVAQALIARPAGADPRRADRRARPQPEIRDAPHHRGDARRQGDHHLDPSARRGRGGMQPRDHHRARPRPRRRHRRRNWPRARAITTRCASAIAGRRADPAIARRAGGICRGSPRSSRSTTTAGDALIAVPARRPPDHRRDRRSGPRRAAGRSPALRVERGRLDDVFRAITAPPLAIEPPRAAA